MFEQIKQYLKLQKELTLITVTTKLASLCSALFLLVVFLILGVAALFYLLMAAAYLLEPHVGGLGGSFAIITIVDLLIIAIIAINRKKWIIKPTVNFLAHLLLDDEKKEEKDEE